MLAPGLLGCARVVNNAQAGRQQAAAGHGHALHVPQVRPRPALPTTQPLPRATPSLSTACSTTTRQSAPTPRVHRGHVRQLKSATAWTQLPIILNTASPPPDIIDLATALHTAQNILGRGVRRLPPPEADALREFVRVTLLAILDLAPSQPLAKGSHTMSTTLMSLARLHHRPNQQIMARLCSRADECLPAANTQCVANTALALALLHVAPAEEGGLLEGLIDRAQDMMPHFRLEETAQLLWALASLDAPPARCAPLFDAALDHWPSQLRAAVAAGSGGGGRSRSRRGAAHLPKNVSQLAFAYAKSAREYVPEATGGSGEPAALAWAEALPAVLALVPRFTPQGLTLVLWTYAKLRAAPRLYTRLVWSAYPAVCAKLGRFTPQGLVMIAYGLALARFRHEPLLDVVTGQCTARMAAFSPRDCAVLAWSLARLAYRDDELMRALRQRYLDTSVHSAQSIGTVSQMLKGCAVSGALTRELYRLLLEQAEGALGSAEQAQRVAQQVRDGYKEMPQEATGTLSLLRQAEHFRHMSRMGALSLDSPDPPDTGAWGDQDDAGRAPSQPARAAQRSPPAAPGSRGNGGVESSSAAAAANRCNGNDAAPTAPPESRAAPGYAVRGALADGAAAVEGAAGEAPDDGGDGSRRGSGPGSPLLPRPSAAYDGSQRSVPRSGVGPADASRRGRPGAAAARQRAAEGPSGEDSGGADLHAQCMAELDDEEVFGRGAQRRRERLEASPFFGEVCTVLREMGEVARPGGAGAGGVLGDLVVSRAAPPPICLQLLEEKQLVAVVRRGQARCTPEEVGGSHASEGLGGGDGAASCGLCWEPDGVARWYAQQLARSTRVAVVSRLYWRQWSAARRQRELDGRLRSAARGVVAWGWRRPGSTGRPPMLGGRAAVA
eukprot:jgi/Ulvmu1/8497/UM044_0031.1